MQLLREALHTLVEAGLIEPLPLDALAHLLPGAINEAALWIARSDRTEQAHAEALHTLEHFLASLRRVPSR